MNRYQHRAANEAHDLAELELRRAVLAEPRMPIEDHLGKIREAERRLEAAKANLHQVQEAWRKNGGRG